MTDESNESVEVIHTRCTFESLFLRVGAIGGITHPVRAAGQSKPCELIGHGILIRANGCLRHFCRAVQVDSTHTSRGTDS